MKFNEEAFSKLIKKMAQDIWEEQDDMLFGLGEFDLIKYVAIKDCVEVHSCGYGKLMFDFENGFSRLFSLNHDGKYRLLFQKWSFEHLKSHKSSFVDWFLDWNEKMRLKMEELDASMIGYDQYLFNGCKLSRSCVVDDHERQLDKYVFTKQSSNIDLHCGNPIDAIKEIAKTDFEMLTPKMRDMICRLMK